MVTYEGRSGVYYEKSGSIITSRGQYKLDDDSDIEFGEPFIRLTGMETIPFNKRLVKSYDESPGVEQTIGVSIVDKEVLTGVSAEDLALHTSVHYKQRDILIFKRGAITVKNVGTGDITEDDTVIPADGGMEKMTVDTQFSLGKALMDVPAGEYGLIFVEPDYEKATI